jgi:four helix bundle protein
MRLKEEFRARTKQYAAQIIRLYVQLPKDREEVGVIGKQLLRSGTSVAAHTREASRSRSNAEFCSKIEYALQEADESQLWIELLQEECGIESDLINGLHSETSELIAILVTMACRTKRHNNQ